MTAIECPCCGSGDVHSRAFPRGIDILVCHACGEQIGPTAVVFSISPLFDPERPAAKPPFEIMAAVQPLSALLSNLSVSVAPSMDLDLMEPDCRAEILSADFAKKLRGFVDD